MIGKSKADTLMSGNSRYRAKTLVLVVTFVAVFFVSFMLGRFNISPIDVIKLIIIRASEHLDYYLHTGVAGFERSWDSSTETVFFQVRFPRVIASALIGAALSLAGVVYQGMFRNPMVSPDILGASSGAGFGAALAILLGFSYKGISTGAFICGLIAVLLAYFISRVSKVNETLAMILAGMMIGSLFTACTSFVKLVADTDEALPAITYWLMGSLASIKPEDVSFAIGPILVGSIPLIFLRWRINLLTVGDDEAQSMGVNTVLLKFVVIFCATLLTSASVAVSGMIGWVGLVIPHFCRMIYGYDYRRLVPTTMLFGATFLMIVDNIARMATTGEIPIGILTAFVGAPIFVYLILQGGDIREQ